jgi:hypothetical protein
VRKEKDDFLAVHELAAANCLIRVVSQLCMLLGFYENDKSEKVLWDYYHHFKEHFPNETYSDGPLLGLEEMRARKKEKSRTACSNKDMTVH